MILGVAAAEQRPISIFSVYAAQDALFYEHIERHLNALKRQGLISVMSVNTIDTGSHREIELEKYLNTAQIILLLLSADFFASDHCYDVMTRALQKHKKDNVCVIPVLLRPVDWEHSPVSALQALPTNGKAVANWRNRDEAYLLITKEIHKIIVTLLNPMTDQGTITENYHSYLLWLIKRTSSLDTRGAFPTPPPIQVKLDELYISIQARPERELQTGVQPH
jgi:hypothetical protein